MANSKLHKAISSGLDYLSTAQTAQGSFNSYSSPNLAPFKHTKTYQTNFTPATILSALGSVKNNKSKKISDRLAKWLTDQKGSHWSFNYWAKAAPERNTKPYPDDLDDTFCSLAGLYTQNPALIDAECLAMVTKLLIATETKVGGPYRTWLVDKDSNAVWLDQDLAVNSNIAYFLSLVAGPIPSLTKLMEKAIISGRFQSPYYASEYPLIYFIARAYHGPKQPQLINYILSNARDGYWDTPMQTALAISALRSAGYAGSLESAANYLIEQQKSNGSWPAESFCLDPATNNKAHYSGSPALTTALTIQALSIIGTKKALNNTTPRHTVSHHGQALLQIQAEAYRQIDPLDSALRSSTIQMLKVIEKSKEIQEIMLLPQLFASSLEDPLENQQLFINLGLANLYGWMAYTIYDDFLDYEGQTKQLPVANMAMRRSLDSFYRALPANHDFQRQVRQTFDIIDESNAWELANCRYKVQNSTIKITRLPNFGNLERLAERSLGHSLSIIGIMEASSVPKTIITAIDQAFRHYLICRQLRDDLHDWEQDIKTGQLNFVGYTILRELKIKPGQYKLASLMPRMKRQFWHYSISTVCDTITNQTQQGRLYLTKTKHLKNPNLLSTLFDDIDSAVAQTKTEQINAKKFLKAYARD